MTEGHHKVHPIDSFRQQQGISKREYIATHVLAGLMHRYTGRENAPANALIAAKHADALIDELNKKVIDVNLAAQLNKVDHSKTHVKCSYYVAYRKVNHYIIDTSTIEKRDKCISDAEEMDDFVAWCEV